MGNSKQDRTIFTDQILDFKASDQSSICMLPWLVNRSRKKSLPKLLSKTPVLHFLFHVEISSHLNHTIPSSYLSLLFMNVNLPQP